MWRCSIREGESITTGATIEQLPTPRPRKKRTRPTPLPTQPLRTNARRQTDFDRKSLAELAQDAARYEQEEKEARRRARQGPVFDYEMERKKQAELNLDKLVQFIQNVSNQLGVMNGRSEISTINSLKGSMERAFLQVPDKIFRATTSKLDKEVKTKNARKQKFLADIIGYRDWLLEKRYLVRNGLV